MHIVGTALWIATVHLILVALEPLAGVNQLHTAETQLEPGITSSPVAGA